MKYYFFSKQKKSCIKGYKMGKKNSFLVEVVLILLVSFMF